MYIHEGEAIMGSDKTPEQKVLQRYHEKHQAISARADAIKSEGTPEERMKAMTQGIEQALALAKKESRKPFIWGRGWNIRGCKQLIPLLQEAKASLDSGQSISPACLEQLRGLCKVEKRELRGSKRQKYIGLDRDPANNTYEINQLILALEQANLQLTSELEQSNPQLSSEDGLREQMAELRAACQKGVDSWKYGEDSRNANLLACRQAVELLANAQERFDRGEDIKDQLTALEALTVRTSVRLEKVAYFDKINVTGFKDAGIPGIIQAIITLADEYRLQSLHQAEAEHADRCQAGSEQFNHLIETKGGTSWQIVTTNSPSPPDHASSPSAPSPSKAAPKQ